MKILQAGKLPQDPEYKGKCRHCQTVFAFKESDVKHHAGFPDSRDPREGGYMTVICPFTPCGQEIVVTKSEPIVYR